MSQADYDAAKQRTEAARRRGIRRDKVGGESSCAVAESAVCDEPLSKAQGTAKDASRRLVRIVSFRTRLLDPDNLAPKFFIDACKYAGAIPDDREQDIALEVRQVKVAKRTEERTEILIERLP